MHNAGLLSESVAHKTCRLSLRNGRRRFFDVSDSQSLHRAEEMVILTHRWRRCARRSRGSGASSSRSMRELAGGQRDSLVGQRLRRDGRAGMGVPRRDSSELRNRSRLAAIDSRAGQHQNWSGRIGDRSGPGGSQGCGSHSQVSCDRSRGGRDELQVAGPIWRSGVKVGALLADGQNGTEPHA